MIEIRELSKRYARTVAVDRLSFQAPPGRVTGFLGPNGAGKSTTMRTLLGLVAPNAGSALVNGRRYASIPHPLREVGALLHPGAAHPGRSGAAHLSIIARSNRIPRGRVPSVLERVGLTTVAHRRVGSYSLGMRQRLGIAQAMLGDPGVLLFDEPVNGLDPPGIRWIRELLRRLAGEGRTVLVSSHLMSEMQLTADHVLIIDRGRLLAETSMTDLADRFPRDVLVRCPQPGELAGMLERTGATVAPEPDGALAVTGLTAATIGDLAARRAIPVHALVPRSASLEEAYLQLTGLRINQ